MGTHHRHIVIDVDGEIVHGAAGHVAGGHRDGEAVIVLGIRAVVTDFLQQGDGIDAVVGDRDVDHRIVAGVADHEMVAPVEQHIGQLRAEAGGQQDGVELGLVDREGDRARRAVPGEASERAGIDRLADAGTADIVAGALRQGEMRVGAVGEPVFIDQSGAVGKARLLGDGEVRVACAHRQIVTGDFAGADKVARGLAVDGDRIDREALAARGTGRNRDRDAHRGVWIAGNQLVVDIEHEIGAGRDAIGIAGKQGHGGMAIAGAVPGGIGQLDQQVMMFRPVDDVAEAAVDGERHILAGNADAAEAGGKRRRVIGDRVHLDGDLAVDEVLLAARRIGREDREVEGEILAAVILRQGHLQGLSLGPAHADVRRTVTDEGDFRANAVLQPGQLDAGRQVINGDRVRHRIHVAHLVKGEGDRLLDRRVVGEVAVELVGLAVLVDRDAAGDDAVGRILIDREAGIGRAGVAVLVLDRVDEVDGAEAEASDAGIGRIAIRHDRDGAGERAEHGPAIDGVATRNPARPGNSGDLRHAGAVGAEAVIGALGQDVAERNRCQLMLE